MCISVSVCVCVCVCVYIYADKITLHLTLPYFFPCLTLHLTLPNALHYITPYLTSPNTKHLFILTPGVSEIAYFKAAIIDRKFGRFTSPL